MNSRSINSSYVSVTAPARLHLGFVDLGGRLGRKFVSLGLTIQDIVTELVVSKHHQFEAEGQQSERALSYAQNLFEKWNLGQGARIFVRQVIPAHSGLGSGTQMALAVGHAISELCEVSASAESIASTLGRGGRSGIGIAAFSQGGFIVDGGRGDDSPVPPVIARLDFPEQWRVLLILDNRELGLHGTNESNAFSTLKPFTEQCADHLARQVLVRVLPGLAEQNIDSFSDGIQQIQQKIGDYFAPAQGGRFTSQSVASVVEYLTQQGIHGVGQSSWGPTGFAFFDSDTRAHAVLRDLQQLFSKQKHLSFKVVSGNNTGCVMKHGEINWSTTGELSSSV